MDGESHPNKPVCAIGTSDSMRRHPFTDSIIGVPLLDKWKGFNLDRYDDTTDPDKHMYVYTMYMSLYTSDDAVLCWVFPTSLKGGALSWFTKLSPTSSTLLRRWCPILRCSLPLADRTTEPPSPWLTSSKRRESPWGPSLIGTRRWQWASETLARTWPCSTCWRPYDWDRLLATSAYSRSLAWTSSGEESPSSCSWRSWESYATRPEWRPKGRKESKRRSTKADQTSGRQVLR